MIDPLHILWLVPILPLIAAAILALAPLSKRLAAALATASILLSFAISCFAFLETINPNQADKVSNFTWFQMGESVLKIGWILDPLSSGMLMMVTFVGTLIFIFSISYMSSEKSFNRFFCYLCLFAGAMLGVIIANSMFLLFIFWEWMGLASYLLIGFWTHKPSATAAAKKAFITTRIGDLGFFIGMLWLYSACGTLLFFDEGKGCLEQNALSQLGNQSSFIALFILWGAMGKSGQWPLHVWLPDAMEGPTPVSAFIHAATMVAAGVFLLARLFPLLEISKIALIAITWIGALTALLGALIAIAQSDIKRILAYSTISQLGYMMLGLGTGGVAVAMFHLMAHAFFKALLFLGAGSVIHKSGEQDIRKMGGLAKIMPMTFVTYAIGMLALSGFPLLFSGFWSKDAILHNAHLWDSSPLPFYIGLAGVFLTAFYMARQMAFVFFGENRSKSQSLKLHKSKSKSKFHEIHENPMMIFPLILLAIGSIFFGFLGTPALPLFQNFLNDQTDFGIGVMLISSMLALAGLGFGWRFYRKVFQKNQKDQPDQPDPLQRLLPRYFSMAKEGFQIDALYRATLFRIASRMSRLADFLDRRVFHFAVLLFAFLVQCLSWITHFADDYLINGLFNQSCKKLRWGSQCASRLQGGQVQGYLKIIALSMFLFAILVFWFRHP